MSERKVELIKPEEAKGRQTSGGGYITFFYQEQRIVSGTFRMPPKTKLSGKGPMSHPGDETYYVLKGPAYCDLPDENRTVRIEGAQGLRIPAGTRHTPHNMPGQHDALVYFLCTDWP